MYTHIYTHSCGVGESTRRKERPRGLSREAKRTPGASQTRESPVEWIEAGRGVEKCSIRSGIATRRPRRVGTCPACRAELFNNTFVLERRDEEEPERKSTIGIPLVREPARQEEERSPRGKWSRRRGTERKGLIGKRSKGAIMIFGTVGVFGVFLRNNRNIL